MDVSIRFWNNSKRQAETRYLRSEFLHRPNAENLANLLSSALKHLDQKKSTTVFYGWPLIQLECFGYSIWEKKWKWIWTVIGN